MSKKPKGRFLLTWNDDKHPEVTEFFNEIDEGLYSYTLREVIKTYMEQKNSPNHSNKSDSGLGKEKDIQTTMKSKANDNDLKESEYKDFNAEKDL